MDAFPKAVVRERMNTHTHTHTHTHTERPSHKNNMAMNGNKLFKNAPGKPTKAADKQIIS